MRVLIQRVTAASVAIDGHIVSSISSGLLLLTGLQSDDTEDDFGWAARKVVNLRVFADQTGIMNRSILDAGGELLAVSQFTLYASLAKGNRPSYSRAAPSAVARNLFDRFVDHLFVALGRPVATGVFGADMQVTLTNDGPVTLWLDSRARE